MAEQNAAQEDPFGSFQCFEEIDGQQVQIDCPDGVLASHEKAQQRMSVCKSCPSYKPAIFMCGECKCIMPAKTKINNSVCPLGKW